VLAIPTIDIAKKVIGIGDCSGAEVDKFKTFGLTPLPVTDVKAIDILKFRSIMTGKNF
jgi:flavin reductase (DIM6/NTAB) family NADH-FMN oxidoreductase RutF